MAVEANYLFRAFLYVFVGCPRLSAGAKPVLCTSVSGLVSYFVCLCRPLLLFLS